LDPRRVWTRGGACASIGRDAPPCHRDPGALTTGAMDIRKPTRATRTYTQHLTAPPERVFPLLCPVREADWIAGWEPRFVISESGVAEADCVFVTAGSPSDAVWLVTRHEPAAGVVEMVKITPQVTACRLHIALAAAAHGCDATITYSHTSLGPEGDRFVAGFTEEHYVRFMRDWESRLNHYLATGTMLRSGG
jgi:hypothetical protein